MKNSSAVEPQTVKQAIALARVQKPAYKDLYALLEPLFLAQIEAAKSLELAPFELSSELVQTKWQEGFPLLQRWDFPVDALSAETVLSRIKEHIPESNRQLSDARTALSESLARFPDSRQSIWQSFLQHDWEPWDEWIETAKTDTASLLFLARSCLRPSIERTREDIFSRFSLPEDWFKGYCPLCGSLPSLLYLEGEGERKAYCSWCGTHWGIHRIQCPYCDNRAHESLGYIAIEAEPSYRAHYCRLCKTYFKLIDTREMLDTPYFPLEEWTTLHLDLLAQRAGWQQAPSPSPTVYGRVMDER